MYLFKVCIYWSAYWNLLTWLYFECVISNNIQVKNGEVHIAGFLGSQGKVEVEMGNVE